jgi:methylenetetrahydrofolate dehydrogenase (NAD+)
MRQVSRDDIEQAILNANSDNTVDGIIVYYPIFNSRQDQYLQQIVDMSKDVEGLSHRYIFNMYQNIRFLDGEAKRQKSILPCTPLANIKILEYLNIYNTILPYGNRLFGHTICVVNRSEVVGRPLAALLANDGACVYSVDITGVQKFTRGEGLKKKTHEVVDLEGKTMNDVVPLCDVVISGVPGEKFKFDTSLLREGAVCVNFSSEKVCVSSAFGAARRVVADCFAAELPSRGPRQGVSFRSLHWKGYHCCSDAQPSGTYYLYDLIYTPGTWQRHLT